MSDLIDSPEVKEIGKLINGRDARSQFDEGVYIVDAQGPSPVLAHNDSKGVFEELGARIELTGAESISAPALLGMLTAVQVYRARLEADALDPGQIKVGMTE